MSLAKAIDQTMKRLPLLLLPLLLAACAYRPTIKPDTFARPRSVAIVEAPAIRVMTSLMQNPDRAFHFTSYADRFFVVEPHLAGAAPAPTSTHATELARTVGAQAIQTQRPSVAGGAAMGAAAGLVGALIDANAEAVDKAAQGFHNAVMAAHPGLDLRSEFSAQLQAALRERGIETVLVKDSLHAPPRLRWPASGVDAKLMPVMAGDIPAVDADILIQYSPYVVYEAGNGLHPYQPVATIGIALYNGRTKEFLGHQVFGLGGPSLGGDNSYWKYANLVADIPGAIPALRAKMLAHVPEIADLISKRKGPG